MGCGLEQTVALLHRFAHKAQLAVFEVANTSVDHVGGRGGCSGDVVAALDENNINALQREVTEGGKPVDASTNDQYFGLGTGSNQRHIRTSRSGRL